MDYPVRSKISRWDRLYSCGALPTSSCRFLAFAGMMNAIVLSLIEIDIGTMCRSSEVLDQHEVAAGLISLAV